ncbi:MAG TPA: phospholipase D-like domain-containing protein [Solirubrobacterales bacterium]|nr:phospholipase D-like domain-containing protein [Solirubrobacterales bacterium]
MAGEGSLVEYARGTLLERIKKSRTRAWLVAPFLSGAVADEIIAAAEASDAGDLRLLTALTERSVRSRVLDAGGLRRLSEAGFEVRSLQGLHAKVSVVDRWGLVGSGNLTDSGLGGKVGRRANIELGVVLSRSQVSEAATLVDHWWRSAEEKTALDIAKYEALPPYPQPKGDLDEKGRSIGVLGTGRLREIVEEDPPPERSYWLDPNYHDYSEEGWWRDRGWVSDRRDVGIRKGDLVVIYLAARNGGPAKCAAVGRALGPAEKRPDFLRKERDAEAAERWPWVTEIEVIGDVPADDGVGLDVIGKTGQSLQGGPIAISRGDFETLAQALIE